MIQNDISKNIKDLKVPGDVILVAVSKTKPSSMIKEAYQVGQRHFGENYMQEAIQKVQELKELRDIKWHFIGHLQSNKASLAVKYFDMIQTVDTIKIANKLNTACLEQSKTISVLIQVNIGNEEQKYGVLKQKLPLLLEFIDRCPNIDLKGLMCIPPFNEDSKPYFEEINDLFHIYEDKYNLSILSMGMSSDYKEAIKHGSNMVRIGSKIFGQRN